MTVSLELHGQRVAPLALVREQVLVYHPHQSYDATNNGADAGEKCNPSLPINFRDFHMQRTHFVKEEDAG